MPWHVEALGEPAINRSEQFARLLHLAPVAPEACEKRGDKPSDPRIWRTLLLYAPDVDRDGESFPDPDDAA